MDDLDAVLELVIACDTKEFGEPDYSREELLEDWEDMDLQKDAWVVASPTGELAGYANVTDRAHVRLSAEVYVHPECQGRGIGAHLVRVTERRANEHVPLAPPDVRVTLDNYINSYNETAGRLLGAEGYTLARRHWRMTIDMDSPPPSPVWPNGMEMRTFVRGQDDHATYRAITEAFADMWGYMPPSFEEWQAKIDHWYGSDPTLWFLATDGEEIAGAALCTYRLDMGWVRSLGVRRPWRQRGVGLALLREAFGEFYRRGRQTVGLGVDSESLTGATRLYERAGMTVNRQFDQYRKELRAGIEQGDHSTDE